MAAAKFRSEDPANTAMLLNVAPFPVSDVEGAEGPWRKHSGVGLWFKTGL